MNENEERALAEVAARSYHDELRAQAERFGFPAADEWGKLPEHVRTHRLEAARAVLQRLQRMGMVIEYRNSTLYIDAKPQGSQHIPEPEPPAPQPASKYARVDLGASGVCPMCGGMMVRTGPCLTCQSCGHNDGCS